MPEPEDCLSSAEMHAHRPSAKLDLECLQFLLLSAEVSTWAELEATRVESLSERRSALISAAVTGLIPLDEMQDSSQESSCA
jgi:hypothetical protein